MLLDYPAQRHRNPLSVVVLAARLYAIVVVVVLSALGTAELFVLAWLASYSVSTGKVRGIGDDTITVLASSQILSRRYQPVKLEMYSSYQISCSPALCKLIYCKEGICSIT
jgi:hypothetical protein